MRSLAALLLVVLSAAAAEAKEYRAERFDSRVRVNADGSLHVTETVVFRFDSGTFTHVFRQIPARRTDGIDILSARIDGRAVQPEVERRNGVRVTWRFPSTGSNTTRTFELTYVVRGAIRVDADADAVIWMALPREHAYRIESSRIDFELPADPIRPPAIETRRVDASTVATDARRVTVTASGIGKNGWIDTTVMLPRGTAAPAPAAWQLRAMRARDLAPRWIAAAGIVAFAGVVLLMAMRQNYDAPPRDPDTTASSPAAPDDLPPPVAGVLTTNGSVRFEHAMAALFALAERGQLTIREQTRGRFGQRNYVLERNRGAQGLRPLESAILDLIFERNSEVPLSRARSRLVQHLKRFSQPLLTEMRERGFLDDGRQHLRKRYAVVGVMAIVLAALSVIPAGLLTDEYGGWTMLIPGALALTALLALVFYEAVTPLTNDALRRSREWRSFKRHLKEVAGGRAAAHEPAAQVLPFAIALGLGSAWSKYLRNHPDAVPGWFQAFGTVDAGAAFAAFVVTSGASGGSTGGSGAGAGGGASGAG